MSGGYIYSLSGWHLWLHARGYDNSHAAHAVPAVNEGDQVIGQNPYNITLKVSTLNLSE